MDQEWDYEWIAKRKEFYNEIKFKSNVGNESRSVTFTGVDILWKYESSTNSAT